MRATPQTVTEFIIAKFAYGNIEWEWAKDPAVLCRLFSAIASTLQYNSDTND